MLQHENDEVALLDALDGDFVLPEIVYVRDVARWLRTTEKPSETAFGAISSPSRDGSASALRGAARCCMTGRENAAGWLGHPT